MILCDTGPMIALIDRDDQHHLRCSAALHSMPADDFVTAWPCLTEAMHLLWRAGGAPAQEQLWEFIAKGLVRLHAPDVNAWSRMRELMRQYHDLPMDLADASFVQLAEHLNESRIFTLDDHFRVYRINGSSHFACTP